MRGGTREYQVGSLTDRIRPAHAGVNPYAQSHPTEEHDPPRTCGGKPPSTNPVHEFSPSATHRAKLTSAWEQHLTLTLRTPIQLPSRHLSEHNIRTTHSTRQSLALVHPVAVGSVRHRGAVGGGIQAIHRHHLPGLDADA